MFHNCKDRVQTFREKNRRITDNKPVIERKLKPDQR